VTEIGGSGPPPIPAGAGKLYLTQPEEPYRTIILDAAAFDWLWRITEAKLRQFDGRYPDAEAVARRAVIAFREAAGTLTNGTAKKPRRRLVKTVPNP
jgi:hypothetical protein